MVADTLAPCVSRISDSVESAGRCLTRGGISTTFVLLAWRNGINVNICLCYISKIARKGFML